MNIKNQTKIFTLSLLLVSLTFCKEQSVDESINFESTNLHKTYLLDYDNAYTDGFAIPSFEKDNIHAFDLSFFVDKFNTDSVYYKIYYQNESYKFPDNHELAYENFYGSFGDTKVGFKKSTNDTIHTKFRILGNPRNEKRYFSKESRKGEVKKVSQEQINTIKENILANKDWKESIEEKASKNNYTLEEQIDRDAKWIAKKQVNKIKANNRWQRNPRTGIYSVLIVITNKKGLNTIPEYIKDINKTDENKHINPYFYFLHGKGANNKNIRTLKVSDFITVKANVPLNNGIYLGHKCDKFGNSQHNTYVNNSHKLKLHSAFKYHVQEVKGKSVMNIPEHADFLGTGYTKKEYELNRKKDKESRIETFFTNSVSPNKKVGYSERDRAIWFLNPGNREGEYKKENVGLKTRHGFSYGKYTFKIKMAELLTKDNVWTGLTNAIWLHCESMEKWNRRRICKEEGFMPFYGAGKGEKRVPYISYSEIDFEILKASQTWPGEKNEDGSKKYDPDSNKDKVMIACTNWDMACKQPEKFYSGLEKIEYKDQIFPALRWDEYYNALTLKTPTPDDELFGGDYYYFQLEWKPQEIIWKIGPNKKQLRVVGYMNDKVTTIPNNQMLVIITQEYHFSHWWPMAPFNQEDIPFNSEDLKGYLYSIEIE